MTRVILASASAGRLRVLRQAGIDPVVIVSGVDEDALIAALPPDAAPGVVTTTLARAKAETVAAGIDPALRADAVVIGCDSMLFHQGALSGKPASRQAARAAWRAMAGTSGQLYTGHCVVRLRDGDVVDSDADFCCTTVCFGAPEPEELEAYLASGEPLAVAGSFTLDGLGGWFIDGVDGDPSAVVGVGLPLTRRMLARVGLSPTALWSTDPAG